MRKEMRQNWDNSPMHAELGQNRHPYEKEHIFVDKNLKTLLRSLQHRNPHAVRRALPWPAFLVVSVLPADLTHGES